jgi:hypothetical protein
MSLVGFEPTIPASERAKTVHGLNPAATVTVYSYINTIYYIIYMHLEVNIYNRI